jgi:alkylation response protein AidB-like acyl-CoA dehydrogenase
LTKKTFINSPIHLFAKSPIDMTEQYISLRNLRFMLYEVLGADKLTQYPLYQEHSQENFEMILDAALELGDRMMRPYNIEMDRNEPQLVDGKIRVHPKVRDFMLKAGEGGWVSAPFPYEAGGMQLPNTINSACGFIFNAANYSMSVFPFLATGSAGLIHSFAAEEYKQRYLPKMFAGEWQGTMALTEPDAGSSLSDITTTAEPTEYGYYKIKGQKIYISCGDHDACENVVHLMLAKIKGAPLGVKGISLFIVPQKRIKADNSLEYNDVQTAGLFHKCGYKGAPIAHLSMGNNDDCRGWLVGEPHKGLTYMFQMMNEARIGVGMNATGIASAAYYASLKYAKERPQGRKIENKDVTQAQVPIIQHADVKRMLLFQRAVVEGSLSLLLQCAYYTDLERVTEGEEKEKNSLLLDFLTPIAKTYPSEMGVHSTSAAVQILGGAGYCKDFPVEQFFRESRIHPIHEGTTGIHGLDLLGRKISMKNGKAFQLFLGEINDTIDKALIINGLQDFAQSLQEASAQLQKVTQHLFGIAQQGETEKFMADATLFLEMTGIIAIAWQWLKQGVAILVHSPQSTDHSETTSMDSFYQGKMMTLRYFFQYELPKIEGLATRLKSNDFTTVEMQEGWFE